MNWNLAAERFAELLPATRWDPGARGILDGVSAATPLVVAFSGGADSLAVLLSVWATYPERRAAMRVLHFNHGLRGTAATRDAAFCAKVCATLGVQFRSGRARWPRGTKIGEHEARQARWAFFAAQMTAVNAPIILLGHQRDDVIETMLMRLARGVGGRGLSAPRPVQNMCDGTKRLRPWLGVPKVEIVAALHRAGVRWCTDATNFENSFFRNRLRNVVLPAWANATAPADLGAAVARSRELLEEEDVALELWVDQIVPKTSAACWKIEHWPELPRAVSRRALHRWLLARGISEVLSRAAVDELLAAIWAGRDFRSSAGKAGVIEYEHGSLRLRSLVEKPPKIPAPTELSVPGTWTHPRGGLLRAEVLGPKQAKLALRRLRSGNSPEVAILGFAVQPAAPLAVRPWQPGDRYTPFGSTHVSKLQDQFVNRGIPRPSRHVLPVVIDSAGAILWVPGLPPAESTRVTARSRWLVQLTYQPAHPRSHLQDVR